MIPSVYQFHQLNASILFQRTYLEDMKGFEPLRHHWAYLFTSTDYTNLSTYPKCKEDNF